MSEETVRQIAANENGKNWLFFTPPPEEKDCYVSAIRHEAGAVGLWVQGTQLERGAAEEREILAANRNDSIRGPVDLNFSKHPPLYLPGKVIVGRDLQKLSPRPANFRDHQPRHNDKETSQNLTMASSIGTSTASAKLTRGRSTLARTHLLDGKISKSHSLTSRSPNRQRASKIVDNPAQPRQSKTTAIATKGLNFRDRSTSKNSNTAQSPLQKTAPCRTFTSRETVVSDSASDKEAMVGPSDDIRTIEHAASKVYGSRLPSARSPRKQDAFSADMNRLGATNKRRAVSPLKQKANAKRPKRTGPFSDDSNSDASSASEDLSSDCDDSNGGTSRSKEDEDDWGPLPVTPAPKRTTVGLNKAAPSPAPRPAKVVDVARLRRLLAQNTQKQIDSRANPASTSNAKAGSSTKPEGQGIHVHVPMRTGPNKQATTSNALGRSVLHERHGGESSLGFKNSETRPANSAAAKSKISQVKAKTASVRPGNTASGSASRATNPITEALRPVTNGNTSSRSLVSTPSTAKKAAGSAKTTETTTVAAPASGNRPGGTSISQSTVPTSGNRLGGTTTAQSRSGIRPSARKGLVGSLIQDIRKSDQPDQAGVKSKLASIPVQVSQHKSDARVQEDASVASRTDRAKAEQIPRGGEPTEPPLKRVLSDQHRLACSALGVTKGLNLESVGTQGLKSKLAARPLNDNGHDGRVDVSKASTSSILSTTTRKNAEENASKSVDRANSNATSSSSRTPPKLVAASAVGAQEIPRPIKMSSAFSKITGLAAIRKLRKANASSSSINASSSVPQNVAPMPTEKEVSKASSSTDDTLSQVSNPQTEAPKDAPPTPTPKKAIVAGAQNADSSVPDDQTSSVVQMELQTKVAGAHETTVAFQAPTARMLSYNATVSQAPISTRAVLTETKKDKASVIKSSNVPAKPLSSPRSDSLVARKAGDGTSMPPDSDLLDKEKAFVAIPSDRKPTSTELLKPVTVPSSSLSWGPAAAAKTKANAASSTPTLGKGSQPAHEENVQSIEEQGHSQESFAKRQQECDKPANVEPPKAKYGPATSLLKNTPEPTVEPVPAEPQVIVDLGSKEKIPAAAMERKQCVDTPTSSTAPVLILSYPSPPVESEPYFEYCVFQKIWSIGEDESSVTATELSLHPSTNIEEVNSQAERLFHNLRNEYQQHFQVHFSGWSNKRDDHGCDILLGSFTHAGYPKKQTNVKIWVQRDHVSAMANQTPTNLHHTSFISKTVYVLRLFKLLPSSQPTDSDDSDDPDTSARTFTRVYHPHSRTECYTTLDAANRAAKSLQIELSHKMNPSTMDKVWQANNLAELNKRTSELENAKDEKSRYWKSEFNGSGLGSATFELRVEKVGLCGPRNL